MAGLGRRHGGTVGRLDSLIAFQSTLIILEGSEPVSEGCLWKVTRNLVPGSSLFFEFILMYWKRVRCIEVPSFMVTLMRSFWDLSLILL